MSSGKLTRVSTSSGPRSYARPACAATVAMRSSTATRSHPTAGIPTCPARSTRTSCSISIAPTPTCTRVTPCPPTGSSARSTCSARAAASSCTRRRPVAITAFGSSRTPGHLGSFVDFGEEAPARRVGLLPHQHAPHVVDDDLALLLDAARADLDDAALGVRPRLALLAHTRLGVERVAREERMGQLDLVPAERHAVLADVGDAHARYDGQGQRAVDQALAELGPPGEVIVEVDLVRVVGEQGEPDVVGLRDRPAEPAAVDVADVEVLEEPPLPPGHARHSLLLS